MYVRVCRQRWCVKGETSKNGLFFSSPRSFIHSHLESLTVACGLPSKKTILVSGLQATSPTFLAMMPTSSKSSRSSRSSRRGTDRTRPWQNQSKVATLR